MKSLAKRALTLLISIFVFGIAFTPATLAVDGCSSAGFKVAANINLNATPFGIAAADFNGDGHLDLVAALNNGSAEVTVLFGRGGTEKFGPPISIPVGGRAFRVAPGDFNGDGKPDLAVSLDGFLEPLGRLSILLNDGTGQFGTPNILTLAGDPYEPVLGDLNNDGKLDIVTALFDGTTDGKMAILLGNGAGGFSHATNSPLSTLNTGASEVVIGDFNEDGKRDLALPSNLGHIDILLGQGTGSFAPPLQVPNGGGATALTVGDFNGDGHLDLLSGSRMLLGTGTASFAAPIVVPLPANSLAAMAGHVNQDAHLDVVVAGINGLTIMLGNGTGNLAPGKSYSSGFTIFAGGSSFALAGDFNEDGKIDLAAVQQTGIGILDGDGTGAFNDALSYQTNITIPRYLLAADFNNDGKTDFVTASGDFLPQGSRIEVALGDGSGGFTRKSVTQFPVSQPQSIAAADFNSDGKLDLAITRPLDRRVSIVLNDGSGGFPADASSSLSHLFGFEPSSIEAGDFNNDSKADLVVIPRNFSTFVVLLGNGSGTFTVIGGGSLQGGTSFADDVAVGDFNADGKSDLAVVRSSASVVQVLQGLGTGQFSSYSTSPIQGRPASLAIRDLNGDGKPDIAVSNAVQEGFLSQPYITVLLHDGAQGFNPGTSYPTDGEGILGVGDFNGDNQPDLAVSSGVAILTNRGNGEFNAPVNFSAGQAANHLVVGDFNNDGKDDAAISQPFGNSVGLLLGTVTASQQCLSVNDVTLTENDVGTIDAIFTVKLSAASAQTVRVNYFVSPAFLSGSTSPATKGVDFEDVSDTLTFAPGETTKTLSVPVKGDFIDEFDQYFFVSLTTPVNAVVTDGKGLGTIIDDDSPAAMSINDVVVAEGNHSQINTMATFTVSLNAPSEKPISVQFSFEAGTATSNIDYGNFSSTVDFPVGTVSKTFSVGIIGDITFEPDETFFANLSNATNATITDGQGQVTISNDDPPPTVSIAPGFFLVEGATGTSVNAQFEVKLTNPSYQTIAVSYATADGTATAGADYVATSGTFTFNPGETSKLITVQVNGDDIDEINETYLVNLSNPSNTSITSAQGVGTIQDDDGPSMSIGAVSVTEGHIGFVDALFTVTLSAASVQDIVVNYATTGGTATSNVDFQRVVFRSLLIPAGTTSGTIPIRIFSDFQIEPDEQFTVTLGASTNATVANSTGTGTIVNDDSNGKFQFSSAAYTASEEAGNAVISVTRVDGATGSASVDYATSNGTATAGSDYTATSGTLTFSEGETSKSFSVPLVNDNLFEVEETFNLTLSNPTGGAVLGATPAATLTIKTPLLLLALEESGPGPQSVAALDSLLLMRDPFRVIPVPDLLYQGSDRNTRVIVFVANLQSAPDDSASVVRVHLVDSYGGSYDVGAEDVRIVPFGNLRQVTFRLPDQLAAGVCNIKIKARDQESDTGTIRIMN